MGGYSTVLRTPDLGSNWYIVRTPCITDYNAIQFVSPNEVFVVGNGGCIIRSTNSGGSWDRLVSGTTKNLFGMLFSDNRFSSLRNLF